MNFQTCLCSNPSKDNPQTSPVVPTYSRCQTFVFFYIFLPFLAVLTLTNCLNGCIKGANIYAGVHLSSKFRCHQKLASNTMKHIPLLLCFALKHRHGIEAHQTPSICLKSL